MHIKVQGGTVTHGDGSLCVTCGHSTIIRGEKLDERIVECHASVMDGRLIPFRVTSCSSYIDVRQPSYGDMVRIAWILQPHATKRRPAGFVRCEELSPKEFAELVSDGPVRMP
jgi:hypothetical protein